MAQIIRLRPFHYMHLMDTNTNIVSLVSHCSVFSDSQITGPTKLTCLDNHKVLPPTKMVFVPPSHYVVIDNPVRRKKDPKTNEEVVEFEKSGQVKLRYGDQEIRRAQEPFPLYEGESCGPVQPLQIVQENTALVLRAKRSFFDKYGKKERRAGEQWLFKGPNTYYPQVEVEVLKTQPAVILKPDQALLLQATMNGVDYQGQERKVGEKWLAQGRGAYLPSLTEQVLSAVTAHTLTDTKAIHLQASASCIDALGVSRKAGEVWMVTKAEARTYIPEVHEKVTSVVNLTILSSTQFCIVYDPVDATTGLPKLGSTKLVRGPKGFFLKPGESVSAIQERILLDIFTALLVEATQGFKDNDGVYHKPGEQWMVYGPAAFCCPHEAVVRSRIHSFFYLEPLGLYFFRPRWFAFWLMVFGLWFLHHIMSRWFDVALDDGTLAGVTDL